MYFPRHLFVWTGLPEFLSELLQSDFLSDRMPFLTSNQQCQIHYTEDISVYTCSLV